MRSGFTVIESVFMIVALFVFTWLCLGVLNKRQMWPFERTEPAAASTAVRGG